MTVAKSIRQYIIEDVIATLKDIKTTGGYNYTVTNVSTVNLQKNQINEYPAIIILPSDERNEEINIERYDCFLQLTLVCLVKEHSTADINEAVTKLLADVKKVLLATRGGYPGHTRGGYALNTKILRNAAFFNEVESPVAVLNIDIEIYYRERYGDPTTVA